MESLSPQVALAIAIAVVVLLAIVAMVARRKQPSDIGAAEHDRIEAPPVAELPARAPSVGVPSAALPPPASFMLGLARTRERLSGSLRRLFGGGPDEGALEALEEDLIAADVGVKTATLLVDAVRSGALKGQDPRVVLGAELKKCLGERAPLVAVKARPHVILVVGVNGSGKTTTIGKLSARFKREGMAVVLGAGDTFRAGAIEQLKVWSERTGAHFVAQQEGSDPAAVAYDAIQAAMARKADVVICDTAGRLQSQKPLMDELGKVVRIIKKAIPDAPHEVLLVLDATIGQNALSQARVFKEVVGVTGVVLTKLDGTAKGGVVAAVTQELGLAVKLLGLGEKVEDLKDFDPDLFVEGLLGSGALPDAGQASA